MPHVHLLLGDPGDSCCAGVDARLAACGLSTHIVASPLVPPARFAWRLDEDGLMSQLELDGEPAEVEGVLVRGTTWLDPTGWAPEDHTYMQAELLAATLAWLASLPCPVVNRPTAALWYRSHTPLVAWRPLLHSCGLNAPEQMITNDPSDARAFGRRLAIDGVAGAVYTPLTTGSGYLVATDAAWQGLADLQERSPICLSEPHGSAWPACIVGSQIFWDHEPPREIRAIEPRLAGLGAAAGVDFLEVVTANLRGGPGVVMVEPMPVLEHFTAPVRARILDALSAMLAPVFAEREAVR